MAKQSLSIIKIIAIVLMVTGIGLVIWGYQTSDTVGSQITRAFSGSDSDKVMTLYISAAVSFVVGLYLFIKK